MTKKGMDVPPFATEERSPLKDLTNTTMDGSANLTHNQTNDPKRKSVQSWYARMSDEKKAEYNAKRRISRQQKKVAALDCASQDQFKQKFVPPLGIVQRTPFSDITNRQTKGTCATSTASISANTPQTHASGTCATSTASIPANTPHTHALGTCATSTASIPANTPQTHASETCATSTAPICQQQIGASANKQGGKGWYANLSDEKKAEHLRKLRMAREQKRTAALVLNVDVPQSSTQQDKHGSAQSGITRILGTPTGDTNMEEDGSVDWLHTNPTYKQKVRSKEHVAGMDGQDSFLAQSFILGSSIEPIDASYEKERLRKRTKYFDMAAAQKDVVLSRNRAYKKRKRDTITLSDQHDITDGMCGSTDQSSSAPAITVQPLYKNYHRGGCSNEEDSDAHGIFEPMGQTSETEECLDTIQEEETLNDDDDDDECRLYSAQGNEFESYRVTADGSHSFETHDPYDYVYKNLPTKHHVLKPVKDCVHCGAMRFQYEGPAFCCRKGKVKVFIPEVPQELQRLFTSQVDKDAKYFRQHIRYFNSHFSFTSLGVTLDQRVNTAARTGIYTFRAHGQLYHRLDHLVPGDHGPRHLQLYIYDTDEALEHRVKRSPDLDINLIRKILRILENNPYVETFKSLGSVPDLAEYKITLNTNITLDQRRYNAPTASQVAAMWVEGSDPQHTFDRSVIVHAKGDRPLYIRAYYGCYDPLAYPLFHPGGETGWNRWLPYEGPTPAQAVNEDDDDNQDGDQEADDNDEQDEDEASESRKYVSAREYYCYKLQIREGIFNIVSFGGRLFQQWIVDMYIKMETMRLDFYSKPQNQKLIRAELYQLLVCSHL